MLQETQLKSHSVLSLGPPAAMSGGIVV